GPRARADGHRYVDLAGRDGADLQGRAEGGVSDPAPAADGTARRMGCRRGLDAGVDRVRPIMAGRRGATPMGGARRALANARPLPRPGSLPPPPRWRPPADAGPRTTLTRRTAMVNFATLQGVFDEPALDSRVERHDPPPQGGKCAASS